MQFGKCQTRNLPDLLPPGNHLALDAAALAVRAACPTAWAAHAGGHFGEPDLDAACARFGLFGFLDPADPFVSRQGGDIFPECMYFWHRKNSLPEICWQCMDRPL